MIGTGLSRFLRIQMAHIGISDDRRDLPDEKVAGIAAPMPLIHPTNLSLPQKQLALIVVLEELVKTMPTEWQVNNTLACVTTMLLGSRLLTAVSGVANGTALIEDA